MTDDQERQNTQSLARIADAVERLSLDINRVMAERDAAIKSRDGERARADRYQRWYNEAQEVIDSSQRRLNATRAVVTKLKNELKRMKEGNNA